MLSSTQDILYIVLAFSIIWFTVFLCYLLYQAARVLRNANRIVENLTNKLELIADAVQFIKNKVDSATDHMGTLTRMVSGTVGKAVMNKLSSKLEERIAGEGKGKSKKKK